MRNYSLMSARGPSRHLARRSDVSGFGGNRKWPVATLATPLARRGRKRIHGLPGVTATTQAVAAVKAKAAHRAVNQRAIVDDLRAQGIASARAIATELNERGILTRRDGA